MYATDTILTFGFPIGRLGGARFRISFLFPMTVVALMWRFDSVDTGLLAGVLLFCSVLLHELAHLVVARSTGDEMDEVAMWPLGGLEEPYGRGYWHDHLKTMLAGPLTNLLIAFSCLLTLTPAEAFSLLDPLTPFSVSDSESLGQTICRLAFLINSCLFLVNLIPVTPFDAGLLLRTYLTARFAEIEGRDLMVRLGLILGLLGILLGFVFDFSTVTAVSGFVLILHLHENLKWYESVDQHERLAEYELSQEMMDEYSSAYGGYDDFNEPEESSAHQEVIERWRVQKEQEQRDEEHEQRQQEDEQVDQILKKLHIHGREALSSHDLHLLNRVGDRYRDRKQHN